MGDLVDVHAPAPDVVLTSTVARRDQAIEVMIHAWWDQMAGGDPMDAPMERIMFHMPQGGGDIAPLARRWSRRRARQSTRGAGPDPFRRTGGRTQRRSPRVARGLGRRPVLPAEARFGGHLSDPQTSRCESGAEGRVPNISGTPM